MPKINIKFAGFFLGLILTGAALAAEPVAVNPAHPDRYTVVKGDTLWDISGRFLRDPWRWPDVWHVNPQIANPHLIYPGDIIEMTYVDGKPRLGLVRGTDVKLSPKVRTSEIEGAIPTIPLDAIFPFLSRPYVVDKKELDAAPYVVEFDDEHLVAGAGQKIYVRSVETADETAFDVVHPGDAYRDAETGEILGYEALYVGGAKLLRTGDPATLLLTSTEQEVLIGNRLLVSINDEPIDAFYPKAPDSEISGSIISVLNGVNQIGQYHVVVLDRGASDGLQVGDVLAVEHRGEVVRDDVTPNRWDKVKLPDEKAGHLMVFRTFDRVSFGLIMDATRAMHINDKVRNP
jgi:hypothetical protein